MLTKPLSYSTVTLLYIYSILAIINLGYLFILCLFLYFTINPTHILYICYLLIYYIFAILHLYFYVHCSPYSTTPLPQLTCYFVIIFAFLPSLTLTFYSCSRLLTLFYYSLFPLFIANDPLALLLLHTSRLPFALSACPSPFLPSLYRCTLLPALPNPPYH